MMTQSIQGVIDNTHDKTSEIVQINTDTKELLHLGVRL
jgi:hypothetical protein